MTKLLERIDKLCETASNRPDNGFDLLLVALGICEAIDLLTEDKHLVQRIKQRLDNMVDQFDSRNVTCVLN